MAKIGKSWQKLAKVAKVGYSCQKLSKVATNRKKCKNCHKILQSTNRRPPFTLPATLPITRIFFYYPTRTLPEVKKTLPVTAWLAERDRRMAKPCNIPLSKIFHCQKQLGSGHWIVHWSEVGLSWQAGRQEFLLGIAFNHISRQINGRWMRKRGGYISTVRKLDLKLIWGTRLSMRWVWEVWKLVHWFLETCSTSS